MEYENNNLEKLHQYYEKCIPLNKLSKSGKYHFESKLPYLTEKKKIYQHWQSINYYLKKHNFSFRDKTVFDIGCGTGYTTIYFVMANVEKAVGIDLRESKIEAFRAYASCLPKEKREKIEIIKSSIEDSKYSQSFDMIYAQEAISHIVCKNLFEKLFYALKPGGILYISDNNNELCSHYKKEIYHFWERLENGPEGKCGKHNVEFVYKELRKKIIEKKFGDILNSNEIEKLIENTANLYGKKLEEVVKEYLKTGIYPNEKYQKETPPIHPEYGYYNEKLFDPYKLKKKLLRIGFSKCYLYAGSGIHRSCYYRLLLKLIPLRVKYYLNPYFATIAIK